MKAITLRRLAVAALMLTVSTATTATAQDRPVRQRADQTMDRQQFRDQMRQVRSGDRGLRMLVRRLELDAKQAKAVRIALKDREPGEASSWVLAKVLQYELTNDQKDRLFAEAQRATGFVRGVRFENRVERGRRTQAGNPAARMQSRAPGMTARGARGGTGAMADALNLNDGQKELVRIHRALGVLGHAARQAGRRWSR